MRLLDVGCGWGGMAIHAAANHGARVVGITLSSEQYDWATKRVAENGLVGQVEIRLQDYRDLADGPFDAISSIGMFEHVGRRRMAEYFHRLFAQLRPGGRLLNHAIGRPGAKDVQTVRGRARQPRGASLWLPGFAGRHGLPAHSWTVTCFLMVSFTKSEPWCP